MCSFGSRAPWGAWHGTLWVLMHGSQAPSHTHAPTMPLPLAGEPEVPLPIVADAALKRTHAAGSVGPATRVTHAPAEPPSPWAARPGGWPLPGVLGAAWVLCPETLCRTQGSCGPLLPARSCMLLFTLKCIDTDAFRCPLPTTHPCSFLRRSAAGAAARHHQRREPACIQPKRLAREHAQQF